MKPSFLRVPAERRTCDGAALLAHHNSSPGGAGRPRSQTPACPRSCSPARAKQSVPRTRRPPRLEPPPRGARPNAAAGLPESSSRLGARGLQRAGGSNPPLPRHPAPLRPRHSPGGEARTPPKAGSGALLPPGREAQLPEIFKAQAGGRVGGGAALTLPQSAEQMFATNNEFRGRRAHTHKKMRSLNCDSWLGVGKGGRRYCVPRRQGPVIFHQ